MEKIIEIEQQRQESHTNQLKEFHDELQDLLNKYPEVWLSGDKQGRPLAIRLPDLGVPALHLYLPQCSNQ